ncbi:serine protease [Pseudaestuariivita sp.]|uniref:serine protease n=1 Tax=Pseudaestuariivita sp. TaxID=2211669 RepID=UPI0040591707
MFKRVIAALVALCVMAQMAAAQSRDGRAWIQIEAQPSLSLAQDRLQVYAQNLPDVNGFALGGGWYGIALGPYERDAADQLLRQYRVQGQIPRDSFIAFSSAFRLQFWPEGVNQLASTGVVAPGGTPTPAPETPAQAPAPEPEPTEVPDETVREARASESRLTRAEREELQIALRWAGFYTAAIDGAFGRGTRGAMQAFQVDNNFEPTGVLTTRQRAELLRQYNAVLDGMGLQVVTDTRAGIEMQLPTGVVDFAQYEFPFAQYAPTSELPARVLLISQPGDQATLHGLYDIMETLEIVPLDGTREKRRSSFTLTGTNARIATHVEARLERGEVKGFALIWPAGDEERRTRVLGEMQASFRALPGATLRRSDSSTEEQALDLVSGLKLRMPKLSRSGFWVGRNGTVLTSADGVASCTRITLNTEFEADVIASDAASGVAVLRAQGAVVPPVSAAFRGDAPRLRSEIAVAGYSFEGRLGAPTLTFGELSELRGLDGSDAVRRLTVTPQTGDIGGPVLDGGGAVVGMLTPQPAQSGRVLPPGTQFAASAESLRAVLDQAGVDPGFTVAEQSMDPVDMTALARDMVVLVSCWD